MSAHRAVTPGILLLTVLAVDVAGLTMLRLIRGARPPTDFQKSFSRAGHAHAGVFVILAIVAQLLADAADLRGVANTVARDGIWIAAILFPSGFFLSSAGPGATRPNRLVGLLYLGAAALTAAVVSLEIGLIAA
jgi:hypothetical protein